MEKRNKKKALTHKQSRERDRVIWEMATRIPRATTEEICKAVNIEPQTLYVRYHWITRAHIARFDEMVAHEKFAQISDLTRVSNEAWQAWLDSRRQMKRMSKTKIKGFKNQQAELIQEMEHATAWDQYGDPRFLDVFLRAKGDIRKIMGADAPLQIQQVDTISSLLKKTYEDEQFKIGKGDQRRLPPAEQFEQADKQVH